MKELIQKILSLPPLELEKEELDEFLKIVDTLPKKTGAALKEELKTIKPNEEKIKIQEKNIPLILEYMYAWEEMALHLIAWNKEIAELWQTKFKSTCSADILLPLTIELLPPDGIELRAVTEKLEHALQLENQNEIAFSIINLISAILAKSLTTKEKLDEKDLKIQEKISLLAEDIKKNEQEKLGKLIQAFTHKCNIKKDQLLKNIKTQLKSKYKMDYPSTSQKDLSCKNEEEIQDRIISELQKKFTDRSEKNKTINDLFNEYIYIKDLFYSLNRSNTSLEHKLEEFTAKLSQHNRIFDDAPNNTSYTEKLYSYIPAMPLISALKYSSIYLSGLSRFSPLLWQPVLFKKDTTTQQNPNMAYSDPLDKEVILPKLSSEDTRRLAK